MPKKSYTQKLTLAEAIELFSSGKYLVDFDTGIISSGKTGQPIFTYTGNRGKHLWCRLFSFPKHRSFAVANLVWSVKTGVPVPKGWEVHHGELGPENNSWDNLICVHNLDHKKLHKKECLVEEVIPF